ncbi:tetratricopeptide repeat protein [Caminibacter sp.]
MPLTKTYAKILESQGFKYEALEIYKKLLKKYPNDKELIESIKRLQTRRKFDGVNVIKLKEFDNINQKNRYEFEKWLSEI